MVDTTEAIRIQLQFEADQAEKRAKTMERQLATLENRFDPLARATKRYESGLKTLERGLETGKIDIARYEKGLDGLNREFDAAKVKAMGAAGAITSISSPAAGLTGIINRNRMVFQQAGYQIGDFAVQVQGGQSAMVALSQQGSQMLGVFGAYGAIAGAALAITAPLVGSLFRQSDAAEELEGTTDALTAATSDYTAAIQLQKMGLDELEAKYGSTAAAAVRLTAASMEAARVRFGEAVGASITSLISGAFGDDIEIVAKFDTLDALEARFLEIQQLIQTENDPEILGSLDDELHQLSQLSYAIRGLADDLSVPQVEAVALTNALFDLQNAEVGGEQAAAADALLRALTLAYGTYQDMTPAARILYDETEAIGESALKIVAEMDDAKVSFEDAAAAALAIGTNLFDSVVGADALIGRARTLASELWSAADAMVQTRADGIARGPNGAVNDVRDRLTPDGRKRSTIVFSRIYDSGGGRTPTAGDGDGGGGRSGANTEADRERTEMLREAQRIVAGLMMETEKYNEQLVRLAELHAAGVLTTDQFTDAQSNLRTEMADAAWEETGLGTFIDELAQAAVNSESLGDVFVSQIRRMASEMLTSGLTSIGQTLLGGGGGGGGGLGGFVSSLFGGARSFNGGGFTGMGSRSGGIDGQGGFPAILHPNETVVDHTRGGGAQNVHVTVGISADGNGNLMPFVSSIVQSNNAQRDRAFVGKVNATVSTGDRRVR